MLKLDQPHIHFDAAIEEKIDCLVEAIAPDEHVPGCTWGAVPLDIAKCLCAGPMRDEYIEIWAITQIESSIAAD